MMVRCGMIQHGTQTLPAQSHHDHHHDHHHHDEDDDHFDKTDHDDNDDSSTMVMTMTLMAKLCGTNRQLWDSPTNVSHHRKFP